MIGPVVRQTENELANQVVFIADDDQGVRDSLSFLLKSVDLNAVIVGSA